MPTTTPATPIPTTTPAREAARALRDGLQALAPAVPSAEVRQALHTAAQALRRALKAGLTLGALLDAILAATAPSEDRPVEGPPVAPWAHLLPLSLDAFAGSGAALGVRYPALAVSTWWTGHEAQARRIASERKITTGEVWQRDRLRAETLRAGLDPESTTVERLLDVLGGKVVNWRPPA